MRRAISLGSAPHTRIAGRFAAEGQGGLAVILCLVSLCVSLGAAVSRGPTGSEIAAAVVAVGGASAIACALAGLDGLALLALAVVPWFVVLLNVTPRLTLTIAAAAAAVLLLTRASLDASDTRLALLGAAIFAAAMMLSLAAAPSSAAFIEAAKYCVFPVMVVAVSSETTVRWLAARREILIASGMGAIALQLAAVLLHVGPAGIYYHAGTYANAGVSLGFVSDAPHEMALVGVTVAAAVLITVRDLRAKVALAAIAIVPALDSGVRSAAVALIAVAIVLAVRPRGARGLRASLVTVGIVIVASGAATVVARRIALGVTAGEFSTFASSGSGRGALTIAGLHAVTTTGVLGVLFGHGLGSDTVSIQQALGVAVGTQSDFLSLVIELGLVGLLGWLVCWVALLRARVDWRVLIPLASYAVTNGDLQYVGAVVFAIALAGACAIGVDDATERRSGGPVHRRPTRSRVGSRATRAGGLTGGAR